MLRVHLTTQKRPSSLLHEKMGSLHVNTYRLASSSASNYNIKYKSKFYRQKVKTHNESLNFIKKGVVKAIGTVPDQKASEATDSQESPSVDFAFVHSVLLPDGTPDVHFRTACGGQKLRTIMLDSNIELYGPYSRALGNCAGGGTCGTCMVEVIEGKEILTPRTDKEKEILKKKPKNWRLACQTTVGTRDSRGLVVIQQLPEWKAHEWKYDKDPPLEAE